MGMILPFPVFRLVDYGAEISNDNQTDKSIVTLSLSPLKAEEINVVVNNINIMGGQANQVICIIRPLTEIIIC